MAPFSEILKMLGGQAIGSTYLPEVDLTGKTILVTGANTGLGLECAKHLARLKSTRIIIACRSVSKGEAARKSIIEATSCSPHTDIQVWDLDLSKYRSVLAFGERVRTQLPRLDALIANAGMELQEFQYAEGLEMHLTVNVVSTFLCAMAVLPKLQQTAKEQNIDTSITFCGSMYHIFGPDAELDVPDEKDMFESLSEKEGTDIIWRYALSKLMDHQCFHEFAACLANEINSDGPRVIANLINPGWCGTELSRAKPHPLMERVCFALMGWTAEKGSRTYIHAMAAGRESHGRYLSQCKVTAESAYVQSQRGRRNQKKMWKDLTERIQKIDPEVAGFIGLGR